MFRFLILLFIFSTKTNTYKLIHPSINRFCRGNVGSLQIGELTNIMFVDEKDNNNSTEINQIQTDPFKPKPGPPSCQCNLPPQKPEKDEICIFLENIVKNMFASV